MEDEIAQRLTEVLRAFLGRVLVQLPQPPFATCEYDGVDAHGVRSPYVEFELGETTKDPEDLYLMFFVANTQMGVEISADFGFSTTTLSSLPAIELPREADPDEIEVALRKASEFVFAQVNRAIEEIEHSRGR